MSVDLSLSGSLTTEEFEVLTVSTTLSAALESAGNLVFTLPAGMDSGTLNARARTEVHAAGAVYTVAGGDYTEVVAASTVTVTWATTTIPEGTTVYLVVIGDRPVRS